MLKVNGPWVAPRAVEECLLLHPPVREHLAPYAHPRGVTYVRLPAAHAAGQTRPRGARPACLTGAFFGLIRPLR